jgi:hypothetical protein
LILQNAERKIEHFNKIGIHYEAVYHYVIRRRETTKEIYDYDYLDDITAGLISFDMQRMMGDEKYTEEGQKAWAFKLGKILGPHRIELTRMRTLNLSSCDLNDPTMKRTTTSIYEDLAKSELNRRKIGEKFSVGASKILHFLVPDFFIILDSNARRELKKHHFFPGTRINGETYINAMQLYQFELNEWAKNCGDRDLEKLIGLDISWKRFGGIRSTPLPRIIDKCTFVGSRIDE